MPKNPKLYNAESHTFLFLFAFLFFCDSLFAQDGSNVDSRGIRIYLSWSMAPMIYGDLSPVAASDNRTLHSAAVQIWANYNHRCRTVNITILIFIMFKIATMVTATFASTVDDETSRNSIILSRHSRRFHGQQRTSFWKNVNFVVRLSAKLHYTRTPATDTTNGRAHNNSTTCCTTNSPPTDKNLPHSNILTCRDVGLWHCNVANVL